jgi:hypothetical protein
MSLHANNLRMLLSTVSNENAALQFREKPAPLAIYGSPGMDDVAYARTRTRKTGYQQLIVNPGGKKYFEKRNDFFRSQRFCDVQREIAKELLGASLIAAG